MKNKVKTFMFLVVAQVVFLANLFAAAPVTHTVLAQKWMKANCEFSEEQRTACIVGTLFPDIRYIAKVERSKTHDKNVTLAELRAEKNAFIAGKKLHSYVDEKRAEFIDHKGIYDILTTRFKVPKEHLHTFLKFLEDDLLYKKLAVERTYIALLSIDKEETQSGIAMPILKKWHTILGFYFLQPPSETFANLASLKQGYLSIPPETCAIWSKLIPALAKEEFFQNYARELTQHFDALFAKK